MLVYGERTRSKKDEPAKAVVTEKNTSNYLKILTNESTPLFNLLRDWRKERAIKDGVPQYVIINNMQLAEIAVKKPENLSNLMAVPGIGTAKAKKYGREILEMIKTMSQTLKQQNKAEKKHGP
jgi:ATP-dependent DNA helicase RecQ